MRTTDYIGVNRNAKDRVFRMLFSEKKNALELYNALNMTQYTNDKELEVTTLGDAIYMKMKNDVSFLLNDSLNLYEHQSTVNPNMPVRGLFYFSDMFRGILHGKNLYGSKLLKLPTPVYIVFYNGNEDIGEERWLKLSEAFEHGNEQSGMELYAQMININTGHQNELMARCDTLREYGILIDKIKQYSKISSFESAADLAIRECIREGVLQQFLEKRRSEVMNSILTEFDEEKYHADLREELTEEIREELAGEIREELAGEIREELAGEIREELTGEIRKKLAEEIQKKLTEDARQEAICLLIHDNLEEHVDGQRIVEKLEKHFGLPEAEAEAYYCRCVKVMETSAERLNNEEG